MGKFDIIQWTKKSTTSLRDKQPVTACFGLYPKVYSTNKLIYKAVIVGDDYETPEVGVMKARRYRPGTERFWQGELDLNRYAHQVATSFTNQTLAGRIEIVDQYIAPIHRYKTWDKMCLKMKPKYFRQLTKFEMVLIEEVVRDLKPFKNDKVLEAFSHYSYSESNGENLLYAFRGNRTKEGRYLLLTPEMLTHKYDIHKWFQKHNCNEICARFRRPPESNYPEIKPSNTDIQSDKSFYNFKNNLQPPNYYDDMTRDGPNAPNAPNAPHEPVAPKQNNLETTFGAKSCEGSQSVVTAVVHSDSFGKKKRPTAPNTQKPICRQEVFQTESAISNETYNLIPVPMNQSTEEDINEESKAKSSTQTEDMPSKQEIMPTLESLQLNADLPPEINDMVVDSSTLVARPSSVDFDAPKEIDMNNVFIVGVDEPKLQQSRPPEEHVVDGSGYINTSDVYRTMIVHHDRESLTETLDTNCQQKGEPLEISLADDEVNEQSITNVTGEAEVSFSEDKDLPEEGTDIVECDDLPPPPQQLTDEEETNDDEFSIKSVESPVYININDLRNSYDSTLTIETYSAPVAEIDPSPVLMSPTFSESKIENRFSEAIDESLQNTRETPEQVDQAEAPFTLETFQKQFVLPEQERQFQNDVDENGDVDAKEYENTTPNNELSDKTESEIKENDTPATVVPAIRIEDFSDENEPVNVDDVDSSYHSNSDSLDDSTDAIVVGEKDKVKETNIDEDIPANDQVSNTENNASEANEDFLTKYNLQSFVDSGNNDTNSQAYKLADYKLISDYIQTIPEETQDAIPSQQRPLQSSLKSGETQVD